MALEMRGRSWKTTRPPPMLVWPTSLLPIWPSGSPTSRPEADREVWAFSANNLSKIGVLAALMALPSTASLRPKPSIIIKVVGVFIDDMLLLSVPERVLHK